MLDEIDLYVLICLACEDLPGFFNPLKKKKKKDVCFFSHKITLTRN